MSKIAVFGTGPAGMAAGWAALRAQHEVHFYDRDGGKAIVAPNQHLFMPIPMPPSMQVRTVNMASYLTGTAYDYSVKVFGAHWGNEVTEPDLQFSRPACSLWDTYNGLWDLVVPNRAVKLYTQAIDHAWVTARAKLLSQYAYIVSTIPGVQLCANPALHHSTSGCHFQTFRTRVSAMEESGGSLENEIHHDGTPDASWFRTSHMFGFRTVEWPGTAKPPPRAQASIVRTPLRADCSCHPQIVRMGQHGAWRHGITAAHVYQDTTSMLEGSWVNQQDWARR